MVFTRSFFVAHCRTIVNPSGRFFAGSETVTELIGAFYEAANDDRSLLFPGSKSIKPGPEMNELQTFLPDERLDEELKKNEGRLVHPLVVNHDAAKPLQ